MSVIILVFEFIVIVYPTLWKRTRIEDEGGSVGNIIIIDPSTCSRHFGEVPKEVSLSK